MADARELRIQESGRHHRSVPSYAFDPETYINHYLLSPATPQQVIIAGAQSPAGTGILNNDIIVLFKGSDDFFMNPTTFALPAVNVTDGTAPIFNPQAILIKPEIGGTWESGVFYINAPRACEVQVAVYFI